MSKCIICGCTDEHACPEGCEWICLAPPVCSSCIHSWTIAQAMGVVFALERHARGNVRYDIDYLRKLCGRFGVPTLRRIAAINRKARKYEQEIRTTSRRKAVR